MKRLLLAVLLVCLWSTVAYANGQDKCKGFLKHVLNECSAHTIDTDTQRDEPDMSAGIGADIVILKNEKTGGKLDRLEEVVIEYKADFNGYEDTHHSVYAVARLDASDLLPGIWGKLKSIFKRE